MTISCAIIDDEPLAAGLLESYARKTPYLQLVGTYNSAILAMKDLRTRVIFTTAFPQYAVEGYKVNALDYLLKPISYEDFLKSTDKALEWFSIIQRQDAYRRDRFMFVKTDYKLQRVNLDDILFIEGLKDYVRFYLKDGEKVMSLMSMKKLEEYLPRPEFLRTHRSYIVHMTETPLVDRFRIVFGENYIPVSENYKDDVQNYFDIHTLV